ncbi:MAG: 50S ribosomal protein L10 [Promethearchaeota archaeon]
MVSTQVPQWKIEEVSKLVNLLRTYKTVAVINVAGINDRQIQETRKILRDKAIIKMSKKRLQIRAIKQYQKESGKENLDKLAENIPGQSSLVFTDMDVFELKKIFEENKWMIPAKPNSITPVDIWVPAGDTGLPTGQVISELNMTLRLPTRIQNDTIWIREDTRTHKAGDFVTVKQASVLKKLGVRPLESIIKIHYAWSDGEIIPADVIYMDMEKFKEDFISAVNTAKSVAIELGVIDDETIEPLVQRAYREALSVLFEMPIIAEDMLEEYIKKAVVNANIINAVIFGEGLSIVGGESKDVGKEEPEPEPEEEEEEESVGIGGLFG